MFLPSVSSRARDVSKPEAQELPLLSFFSYHTSIARWTWHGSRGSGTKNGTPENAGYIREWQTWRRSTEWQERHSRRKDSMSSLLVNKTFQEQNRDLLCLERNILSCVSVSLELTMNLGDDASQSIRPWIYKHLIGNKIVCNIFSSPILLFLRQGRWRTDLMKGGCKSWGDNNGKRAPKATRQSRREWRILKGFVWQSIWITELPTRQSKTDKTDKTEGGQKFDRLWVSFVDEHRLHSSWTLVEFLQSMSLRHRRLDLMIILRESTQTKYPLIVSVIHTHLFRLKHKQPFQEEDDERVKEIEKTNYTLFLFLLLEFFSSSSPLSH